MGLRQIDESKLSIGLKLDKEVNEMGCDESKDSWLDINEVIESDFLIFQEIFTPVERLN